MTVTLSAADVPVVSGQEPRAASMVTAAFPTPTLYKYVWPVDGQAKSPRMAKAPEVSVVTYAPSESDWPVDEGVSSETEGDPYPVVFTASR